MAKKENRHEPPMSDNMKISHNDPPVPSPRRHQRKILPNGPPPPLERVIYVPISFMEKGKRARPGSPVATKVKVEKELSKKMEKPKKGKTDGVNNGTSLSTVTAQLLAKMSGDKRFKDFDEDDSVADMSRPPSHAPSEPVSETEDKKNVTQVVKKKRRDYRIVSNKAKNPCIDQEEVIKAELELYQWYGEHPEGKEVKDYDVVELIYPQGSERYPLLAPKKTGEANPVNDIYHTTQMLVLDIFPLIKELPSYTEYEERCKQNATLPAIPDFGNKINGALRQVLKACHKQDRDGLMEAVKAFDEKMMQFRQLPSPESNFFSQLELDLPKTVPYNICTHVLEQAYARTVAPYSELLNQYRGFSNNVYGEVRPNLVQEFIRNAKISRGSVFLDMGSGIGSVVLQVAAQCLADSTGVEIMEIPAKLGRKYQHEFMSRLHYYGLPCGKLRLVHSDFLNCKELDDILPRCDVVFVNNYAFAADLNQKILAKFLDLKEGARVISLKSFVSQDRKITKRNEGALENIFKVKEYLYGEEMVSWTHEGGRYYVSTVDRSHLYVRK
jgi:hypothetical protein